MGAANGQPQDQDRWQLLLDVAQRDEHGHIIRQAIIDSALRNEKLGKGRVVSAADTTPKLIGEDGKLFEVNQYSYSAQFALMLHRGALRHVKDIKGNKVTTKSQAVATRNGSHDIYVYKLVTRPFTSEEKARAALLLKHGVKRKPLGTVKAL